MSDGLVEPAPLAGMAWMALAAALFAVMNVGVRLSSSHVPWSEVAAVRATVGAMVAITFAKARGVPLVIYDRKTSWARSFFGTGAMICGFFTMGATAIALGDAVTLAATSAIFIALLAPTLLGEPGGRRVWVATVPAFAGVALVAGPTFQLSGHLAAVATLGAFFSAMAMIWLRKLGTGRAAGAAIESPEAIVAHFSMVAAVTLSVISIPVARVPDLAGAGLLVGTGALGGLAQLAMTRAYALERASRLGPIGYLGIVLTHVLAVVFLGEHPRLYEITGTGLIVGAGLFLAGAAMRDARTAGRGRRSP